ncbi:MAG: quinone-interacting membrane-bound oxidoreductase complex subunit QmoC, partial [Deltaproteobacteria bacterium]|nr:quinone-interacting membrane-bound oxidoreductase complex subunit QmoC [Deltaproteobacteria bacterium]
MAERNQVEPDLAFVKGVMEAGGDTVNRCYQCATCSIVCPLSTDESPFPRKEMLWAQWGLGSRVAGDADVWLCHNCGDCTKYCPRNARPGDVLSAIRINAIKHYARPKALANMLDSAGGVIGTVIASMFTVMVVAFLWAQYTKEAFPIPEGTVVYHKFLTVVPIDAIFLSISALVIYASVKGVLQFWSDISKGAGLPSSYTGKAATPALGPFLTKYVWPAVKEILTHERFKKCGEVAERSTGHLWVLWSFIILFTVTILVMIQADVLSILFPEAGFETPLVLYHPVKIAANIGAVMLIAGIWMLRNMRRRKTAEGTITSSTQDWILIWLIFAVGVSGAAAEIIRLADVAVLAYPVYVLHLG